MKIVDRFGSRPGAELVRLPQGGERLLAVEHAACVGTFDRDYLKFKGVQIELLTQPDSSKTSS